MNNDNPSDLTADEGRRETQTSSAERVLSLEGMINGYMLDLDKLQKNLKEQSAMLKDLFENDSEYKEADEKVKEATKSKKKVKDKLKENQSVALLESKVQDLKSEVKEVRQALSDYLYKYFRESGMTQITDSDGEIHELVASVRLVKKKE
jgi:predicted nuclease with TOPRIM domain